ncbi:MAG: 50S ribosome-binding GTPase [Firmicutes bacterium]|nr:50S ribosome-binding GTPase [Bacillota bacterium]
MKRCIIIGRPNVGKTMFALQFALYLGMAEARIQFAEAGGRRWEKPYRIAAALDDLTGAEPHRTRQLQSLCLELPAGKGTQPFELVDTSGLVDGIHPDPSIRRAMAQTLAAVREAQAILHMIDAAALGEAEAVNAIGEVDYQVAQFAQMRGGYLLLANKMDLPAARVGLARLKQEFAGHPIAPVSALYRQGFDEVKAFVRRHL